MMILVCPHCGATEFQLWAGIDGKPAVQCLNCGETAALEHARVPRSEEVTVPRKRDGSRTRH